LMKSATYPLRDGTSITLEYDADAPCRICHEPVREASMGGTDVCPWCDGGVWRDGRQWTYGEMMALALSADTAQPP
jgi:hypothetical protein